jgi:diphthine-ammonia ligase
MDLNLKDRPLFCSWSGGKDSCLALYFAMQNGGKPHTLLTVLTEDDETSRSHALPRRVIEEQARKIGLRAVFRSATWEAYEEEFTSALYELKNAGIETGVFGDIDVEEHRKWVTRVCEKPGITPVFPLWKQNRQQLLDEFIQFGFKAQIIVVNGTMLDRQFLGRHIDAQTISELNLTGIDPSGELGEYHTVVTDGPIFSSPVILTEVDKTSDSTYHFLNVDLAKIDGLKRDRIQAGDDFC